MFKSKGDEKEESKVNLNSDVVKKAILKGKEMANQGKTKADISRELYKMISGEDKEVILHVFQEGAKLTEKGAVTYLYNIKRKESKVS